MDETITSRQNALVREAREVRDGRRRSLVFVEGLRLCEEAVAAGLEVRAALYTEELASDARGHRLVEALRGSAGKIARVGADLMEYVSDTKGPQGVLLLAARPDTSRPPSDDAAGATPLVVVLHRVQNPSNAGAMLRVAEAAGATLVVATEGTADLFSPKALRGAMGSTFRLPLWTGADYARVLAWCAARGVATLSTSANASRAHTEVDWTRARAVVVGREGAGLDQSDAAATDDSVRIPMRPPVESLNVAVALAVILYEAARQRGA